MVSVTRGKVPRAVRAYGRMVLLSGHRKTPLIDLILYTEFLQEPENKNWNKKSICFLRRRRQFP